jgi:hypothetical protein
MVGDLQPSNLLLRCLQVRTRPLGCRLRHPVRSCRSFGFFPHLTFDSRLKCLSMRGTKNPLQCWKRLTEANGPIAGFVGHVLALKRYATWLADPLLAPFGGHVQILRTWEKPRSCCVMALRALDVEETSAEVIATVETTADVAGCDLRRVCRGEGPPPGRPPVPTLLRSSGTAHPVEAQVAL